MDAPNILHQVMSTHSLGQILTCSNHHQQQQQQEATPPHQQESKRQRPQPEQALRCPRCDSTNTKFCYYNNYSLSQPRYFCKGCRRYWTQGGTLRNVPVGGGCRKNKRSISTKRSLSLSSSSSSQDQSPFLPHVPYSLKGTAPPSTDQEAFLQIPSLSPSFLDILRGGSLDSTYQGLYSGLDFGVDCSGGWFLPFGGVGSGETDAAVKQESCRGVEGEGRGVGLQWQVGGGGGGEGLPVVDLWSSSIGSNWHGLINSTLM